MAATGTPTPNIGLRIPQGTDPASVDDINYNSTLLDTKLGAVGNESVQDQIDALNSKISDIQWAQENDSFNAGADWIYLQGGVKNQAKQIQFSIFPEKMLGSGHTYTLTQFQGYIFKPGGGTLHGNQDYLNLSGCTASVVRNGASNFLVTLDFTSAVDIPVNSGVIFNGFYGIKVT